MAKPSFAMTDEWASHSDRLRLRVFEIQLARAAIDRAGHQAALLRPHEGAQIEGGPVRELGDAFAQDGFDLLSALRRLEAEVGGGADRPLAMQGKVGRTAVE